MKRMARDAMRSTSYGPYLDLSKDDLRRQLAEPVRNTATGVTQTQGDKSCQKSSAANQKSSAAKQRQK